MKTFLVVKIRHVKQMVGYMVLAKDEQGALDALDEDEHPEEVLDVFFGPKVVTKERLVSVMDLGKHIPHRQSMPKPEEVGKEVDYGTDS